MEFWYIIIVVIVVVILTSIEPQPPVSKGERGEKTIASIIFSEINNGLYGRVLHNVYIPKRDGRTTELDLILISVKGVYVFESKDFAGYIFGDDRHKYWTVTLYAGKDRTGIKHTEKHRFYNPVWQNNAHIKALRDLIDKPVPFYSVVVFSDRGQLKNVTFDEGQVTIIQTGLLRNFLSTIRESGEDVLSAEEVDSLYDDLAQYTNVDLSVKQAHVESIRADAASTEKCPRCGGDLVIKTAGRGANIGSQFYGCANYPKCKYTKSISKPLDGMERSNSDNKNEQHRY